MEPLRQRIRWRIEVKRPLEAAANRGHWMGCDGLRQTWGVGAKRPPPAMRPGGISPARPPSGRGEQAVSTESFRDLSPQHGVHDDAEDLGRFGLRSAV